VQKPSVFKGQLNIKYSRNENCEDFISMVSLEFQHKRLPIIANRSHTKINIVPKNTARLNGKAQHT
jgi:hypothetical protein